MQFQKDWPKDKKLQLFKFLPENLETFRLTEHNDAPLEGLTIFSLSQLLRPYSIRKLSIRSVEICNFQQDRT